MQTNLTNNPLLRRVQRHANMATLFRQVNVEPLPRQPAAFGTVVPVGQEGTSLVRPAADVTAVSPTQPTATEETPDEKRDWSRLQNIYRRHQERIAAEEQGETGSPAAPPTDVQRETAVSPTPDAAPTPPAPVQPDVDTPTIAREDHKETPPGTFGGDVAVKGTLTVGGPMTVGGSTKVSGPASVGGPFTGGGDIRTGPTTVGGSLTAGTSVKQIGGTQIAGDVTTGSNATLLGGVSVGQSVTSGTDMKMAGQTAVGGNVTVGNNLKNAGAVTIGNAATVGNDITVVGAMSTAQGLTVGGKTTILGSTNIATSVNTGNDLSVIGPASIGGAATTGGNLTVTGSVNIGGSATVGGGVKAGGSITVAGELQPPIAPAGTSGSATAQIQQKVADDGAAPPPLESVWPGVQRKPPPKANPVPTVQRKAADLSPAPMKVTGGEETAVSHAPTIQQTLAAVQPGQPTNSAVELVLPRRPRPTQPEGVKIDGLRSEVPGRQEQAASPISNPQTPAPEIATDIGLLPADLWQLVGRTPPQAVVQRQEVDDGAERTAVSPAPTPPAVQRAVPVDEMETAVANRDTPEEVAATTGSDIDIDELAQKVFQDLRRRLSVEWERVRGKFNH